MNPTQAPNDALEKFNFCRQHWQLKEVDPPFHTRTSYLQAVTYNGQPAMLKIALFREEYIGGQLMVWWDGKGAAKVLAQHENAILLERATGKKSLTDMVKQGQDDEASLILCNVAAQLHTPHHRPTPELHLLTEWYKPLLENTPTSNPLFSDLAVIAKKLLATPQDETILHGDLHHANVLDFGEHGWLAIDPKGIIGERAFDFANIFCNPDHSTATSPGRLLRHIHIISEVARLDPDRLLAWVAAWAGLSAMWSMHDADDPKTALTVAQIALEQLRLNK